MKTIKLTEIFVNENNAFVPCGVAQEVKRLINKFRLEVTDLTTFKPYYMDDWQYQDHYELVLTIKPTKVINTRRFSNAQERVRKRFVKHYGWDLLIDAT